MNIEEARLSLFSKEQLWREETAARSSAAFRGIPGIGTQICPGWKRTRAITTLPSIVAKEYMEED